MDDYSQHFFIFYLGVSLIGDFSQHNQNVFIQSIIFIMKHKNNSNIKEITAS